jgi:hypothetical protein
VLPPSAQKLNTAPALAPGFCSFDHPQLMSSNSFAALADVDEEATNQAGKKAQAVAGAIPHASASAGQKKPANGGDRKPVISERVIERHPQGDRKSGTGKQSL